MGRKLDRFLGTSWAPGRFRVEYEGYGIGAERSHGGRYTGIIEVEDGREVGFEVFGDMPGADPSSVYDQGRGSAVLDAIAPRRREQFGVFRRLLPGLVAAIRAADPAGDRHRRGPGPSAPRRAEVSGMADIAAAAGAEGTPLAPVALLVRPQRTCIECGSPVYGEYCTHCMEG